MKSNPQKKKPGRKPSHLRNKTQQLINDYQKGNSIDKLAIKYNSCASTVYRELKRANVKMRPNGVPPNPEVQKRWDQAEIMYQQGNSTTQIAKHFQVSRSLVAAALKKRGIQLRNKGTNPNQPNPTSATKK